MNNLNYKIKKYDFKKIVCEYLNIDDLENLSIENNNLLSEGNDQSTFYHRQFYFNLDNDEDKKFKKLYDKFIIEFISPLFEDRFIYQTYPTFRIHYKKNIAVFEFHKDKDYNHNPKTINFFLPLTKCYDTNTIWIETEENKEDYSPIICEYGNLIMFDGANLKHGNKINETEQTRVSFDFRVLLEKDYIPNEKNSKSKNKKLIIGEYYQKLS
jgi:hypothetical protein